VAILAWFLIVDFPDKAVKKGFLTEDQAQYIERRIEKDRNDAAPDSLTWAKAGRHLLDLKLWALYVVLSKLAPAWIPRLT
jgi:hypothetical protein